MLYEIICRLHATVLHSQENMTSKLTGGRLRTCLVAIKILRSKINNMFMIRKKNEYVNATHRPLMVLLSYFAIAKTILIGAPSILNG